MWYYYAFSFLLHWAFLSSYWRWVNKTEDVEALNWFLHGLGVGLSVTPLLYIGIAWWLILIRAIVLGITMMLWSELTIDVVWEECGRGALIILTLPILFL